MGTTIFAQTAPLATRGKEFWVAYLQNAYGAQSLRLNIASQNATSGTVSMPLTGWSTPFNVSANGLTTVIVPNTAEHVGSEAIANKGVLVQSMDSVTVTAISFQSFTTDAAQVLPLQSLGTTYRAEAYRGLPGFTDFYKSELVVVATQDGTQITITPSVNTVGGHPAGVPFNVSLNRGETYQMQGALAALDVTGTSVAGTAQSGPCRPFAVFSGSMCANVPVGCPACDHVFEEMVPTDQWGTSFHTVTFNATTSYTYRILADQAGTQVSVDGGAPILLNAGQRIEVNGATAATCITANLPISVVELMEGFNCAGNGDPSMVELVPDERRSTAATFATIVSPQITAHSLSVLMPTANIAQLAIDGATVNAALFQTYTGCAGWSMAKITLTAGTHRLTASGGFVAYASGTGTGESYAYGISSVAIPATPPPTIICSSDPVTLSSPDVLVNAEWTTASDPATVIHTGSSYTFTPQQNDTYILNGELPVSGCPEHYEWQVGVPAQPTLDVTANGLPSGSICQYNGVQLNAVPAPDPNVFDLTWTPTSGLSDATIPNPIAYPSTDTWYRLDIVSPVGCGQVSDSVFVNVDASDLVGISVTASDSALCSGENNTLTARAERVAAYDPFDGSLTALWSSVQGCSLSAICGSISGTALRFDGAGTRRALTGPLNMSTGAFLHFGLRIAAGAPPCDDAEPGDDVLIEYSPDGVAWSPITTLNEAAFPNWTNVTVAVPSAAQTTSTRFRWTQLNNSGAGTDNWALDNVMITRYDNTGISFSWSPTTGLNNSTSATPLATPLSNTTYTAVATNASGCQFSASIAINVAPAFDVVTGGNSTICTAGTPVQLQATPTSGTGVTYAWTPNNGSLNNAAIANPIATPAATTTYTVNATTDHGCTDNAQVTITVGQLQSIDVAATDPHLCQGEHSQLTATVIGGSPYSLVWTPNNSTLSSLTAPNTTATPAANTTYTATATETASGCSLSDAITIDVSPAYTIDAGNDQTLCNTNGFQLNVINNVPSPTITWTDAALLNAGNIQSPTILFDTTATYHVSVTDAFGCGVSDSVSVNDAFDTMITPITLSACADQSLVLDAEFPGSSYDWNTNETSQTIVVSTSGNYICTITDQQGCQAVKSYFVTIHPLPALELGPDTSLCGANSFVLDANSPGNGVLWSTSENTQQITVAQTNTYSVTATSAQGCHRADSVHVAFNAMPIDVLQDVTTCVSAPPTLDAGNAGCTYLWSTGAMSQSIIVQESGTYGVTVTTPQQCSTTFDANVLLLPVLVLDLGPDTTLCQGQSLLLDAGVPGLSYSWNTGAHTQSISATTGGTYSVQASNGGCSASDSITLAVIASPLDVLADHTSCIDQPVTLDAGNAGCTYLWNTNAATQQILANASGTYTVVVTNSAHCSSSFDAVITLVGYPLVDLGRDTVLCQGDILDIDAGNPGAAFSWSTGEHTQGISVAHTGTYSVQVNNGFCTGADSLFATFNPRPSRLSTHAYFTCLDEEPHYVVISGGNNGSDYDWSTGENTQVILAGAYGWYYVSITNQFDCSQQDSAVVNEFCPPSIYVPNTFTPNGDGINDVWYVVGKSIGQFEINVFDRWGAVIFHTDNPALGWDGKVNGAEAPNDVYVWRMGYKFIEKRDGTEGFEQNQMGHVTIMR